MTPVAGLLLAAESSTALDQAVQLVDVAGRPLLEVVAERMAAWADPLVVVLGADAEEVLAGVSLGGAVVLIDYDWEHGLGSSMRVGLDHLSRERVRTPAVLALADQPGVTVDLVARLVDAHEGQVTVPVYRYEWGYPMIVDRSQWDRFMSRGLDPLDIARAHPEWVTEMRCDDRIPRRIRVEADIKEALTRFGAP